MSGNRVVVTGLGLVTPLGVGVKRNWSGIVAGECAIRSTHELGPSFTSLASRVAAWEREARALPKYIQFALAAADEAVRDAGLERGCGMAPLDSIGEAHITLTERGARRISPHFIPRILPNMAGGHISIRYGLRGPLLTPSSACATGSHAIGDAYRLIKHGYAKEMIAGGTEAAVNTLAIAGFSQAKALCTIFNESPNISSRPFDRQRDGFVIGEGAGIVVLEEREAAIKRGAKIYGEIGGYGCSADAFHITASHPNGKGAEDAMRAALQEANILPEQVNHVNAHATSTPIGDLAEACAINRLLPTRPIVTANKGSIGHLLGAAGAVESIFTLLSLSHGIIPPTINFEEADCKEISQLNIMSETEQRSSGKNGSNLRVALCNSFGFGGTNASLCFIKHGQ